MSTWWFAALPWAIFVGAVTAVVVGLRRSARRRERGPSAASDGDQGDDLSPVRSRRAPKRGAVVDRPLVRPR